MSRADIETIIKKSVVCRLAFSHDNRPYVVPLNFGFEGNTLYFHSAGEGRKLEIMKKNNHVCFEFDTGVELVKSDRACGWGARYHSVIGFGRALFVEETDKKRDALNHIMRQYSDVSWEYTDANLKNVTVFKVIIDEITGKKSQEETERYAPTKADGTDHQKL